MLVKKTAKKSAVRSVKKHRIEDDTPILPYVVADTVVEEVSAYLSRRGEAALASKVYAARDTISAKLARRADVVYAANENFRKSIRAKGSRGRDQLYVWMRHWCASDLQKRIPAAYKALPQGFANGDPLPEGR